MLMRIIGLLVIGLVVNLACSEDQNGCVTAMQSGGDPTSQLRVDPAAAGPESAKRLEMEAVFQRELKVHGMDDFLQAFVPFAAAKERRNWNLAVELSPHDGAHFRKGDRPELSVRMSCGAEHKIRRENALLIGCLSCKNLNTLAVWSHPFFGGFDNSRPGGTGQSCFKASRPLPCGEYELTSIVCVQNEKGGPLTFNQSKSIHFFVDASISASEFEQELTNLRDDTKLSDFFKASRLKWFLASVALTPSIWKEVETLTSFKELHLSELSIPPSMFKSFVKFNALETLDLSDSRCAAESIIDLGTLKRLKRLDLSASTLPRDFSARLTGLVSLRELRLSRLKIASTDLWNCLRLPGLVRLEISHSGFQGEVDFDTNSTVSGVQEIQARGSTLGKAELVMFSKIADLKKLDLSNSVTAPGIIQLISTHPRIETIDLSGTFITSEDLESLEELPRLTKLRLDDRFRGSPATNRLEDRNVVIDFRETQRDVLESMWPGT